MKQQYLSGNRMTNLRLSKFFTVLTIANKKIDMVLLKCGVTMENSIFRKGNEIYTDVKQIKHTAEMVLIKTTP